jgi:hypothetical protein
MSHVVHSEVLIKDIDALRTAVTAMGCTLVAKKTYNWYGHHVGDFPMPKGVTKEQLGHCDFAIQVPGARYEVGVVKTDAGYTLAWDFYGGDTTQWDPKKGQGYQIHDGQKLLKKFGDKLCLLQQQYSKAVVVKQAKAKGYFVRERLLPNGSLRLQLLRA